MKIAHIIISLAASILLLNACNRVKDTAKNTVNEAGNIAGQTAGEFIEGAAGGVDKVFELNVELSPALKNAGLKTGKCKFESDTLQNGAVDNVAVIYMIFDKDINLDANAKAFDVKNQEMGRKALKITGKANSAGYIYITFDKEANLDTDSKVVIE